jgi:hypothetical protein
MDLFHRKLQGNDTRTGRDCQFCRQSDPDFAKRKPIDRMVASRFDDTASAHFTEDGYVKHRLAELIKKRATLSLRPVLAKSA